MGNDKKEKSLADWRRMLDEPEMQLNSENLYYMLLELADSMEQDGFITADEWRQLIREASVILTREEKGEDGDA